MHHWTKTASLVLLGVTAAFAIACGGGESGGAAAKAGTAASGGPAVTVGLKEFAIEPDKKSVPAGAISFRAQNKGATPHELQVIKTDVAADKIPVKDGKADLTGLQVIGKTSEFAGGKTESVNVTLTAGKYLLVCNVPAHYIAGMTTAFTVE